MDGVYLPESPDAVTVALLDQAHVRTGTRVLDLACGLGRSTLAAAGRAGPLGSVLGLDLAPRMVAAASQFAAARGLTNVEFRSIENEAELGVLPRSVDAALCRHGLSWMPDPEAACRALHDSLRPGGRIAVSVPGDVRGHPLLRLVPDLLAAYTSTPVVWPAPPPSELNEPWRVVALLRAAGFGALRWKTVRIPWGDPMPVERFVNEALTDPALWAALDTLPAERQWALHEASVRAVASLAGQTVDPAIDCIVASGVKGRSTHRAVPR